MRNEQAVNLAIKALGAVAYYMDDIERAEFMDEDVRASELLLASVHLRQLANEIATLGGK
jgi:hypothetical protein